MFSRYRRTPPSSSNGNDSLRSPNKRRNNTTTNSNNQDPSASLEELRYALNRLEQLTEHFHHVGMALLQDLDAAEQKNGVKQNDGIAKREAKTPADKSLTGTTDVSKDKDSPDTKESSYKPTTRKQYRRSPSATAADLLLSSNAHFLSISEKDEEEMVELIRRVAELVVLSERMAGQILEGNATGNVDTGDSSVGGEKNDHKKDGGNSTDAEDNDAAASPYLALFELFCERNALANIVNVVTGAAFAPRKDQQSRENSSNNLQNIPANKTRASCTTLKATSTPQILPPLTIATQAVQSVSILVQNVSRATSLYFLLSNNRVNDLIALPIHLYKRAEMNHAHYARFAKRGAKRPVSYLGLPLPVLPTAQSLTNYTSMEIGELTTHFVSFLKSLAMRVNSETLQFFLTFPLADDAGSCASEDTGGDADVSPIESVETMCFTGEGGMAEETGVEVLGDESTSHLDADVTRNNADVNAVHAIDTDHVPEVSSSYDSSQIMEDSAATGNEGDASKDTFPLTHRSESELSHSTTEEPRENTLSPFVTEISTSIIDHSAVGKSKSTIETEVSSTPNSMPTRNVATAASTSNLPNRIHQFDRRAGVEFPLYARALEFCSNEQDSFVRVTAMNICMNMIRLATVQYGDPVGSNTNENDERCDSEVLSQSDANINGQDASSDQDAIRQSLPTLTPSGVLYKAPSLLIRDQIAIAQYACDPRRLSDLVSPLCARLTSQFGQVEATVRLLDELGNTSIPTKEPTSISPLSRAEKKSRLSNTIRDLVDKVQDELLLLDDLLRVGLISLNEQTIELVLATIVYPMLLQPLLLPLHRFTSSTTTEEAQTHDGMSVTSPNRPVPSEAKPVITLQSPPPFSENIINSSREGVGNHANDNPSAFSEQFPPSRNDLTKCYSSEDMDLAPSKTALFGITVIFYTVSNPSLKYLLLTALLHPFAPPASGGAVVQTPPQITLTGGEGPEDLSETIRMEENFFLHSQSDRVVPVYSFGTAQQRNGVDDFEEDNKTCLCTFILAPALIGVLSNISDPTRDMEEYPRRLNPYRKILMSFLSGSGEMGCLQKLAIFALHAVVSSADRSIIQDIMLAFRSSSPISKAENDLANYVETVDSLALDHETRRLIDEGVEETINCLCQSVINKSVTYDGWWKVKFNRVAARTLLDVISNNYHFMCLAFSRLTEIRLEAAHFLLSLPSRLDEKSREANDSSNKGNDKSNPVDKQHLETWLLDRFYFDQPNKSSNSVVEHVCYLKEHANNVCSKSQYRYGLEVLETQSVSDATKLLCEDLRIVENIVVSETKGNTPFHCAATWALACLSLDAFCLKLSKMKTRLQNYTENGISDTAQRNLAEGALSYFSASNDGDRSANLDSLAHISSKLAMAFLDECDTSDDSRKNDAAPAHGSVVCLVGKAAFPCVCEVSPSFASLFTGRTCVSNEGVQWQSLYLVVVGRYVVLAEPERGGSGGEGRVITSCKLACLAVKKDTTILSNNNTPARRLLLQHSSVDPRTPPLFIIDSNSSKKGPQLGSDGLRLTRSRMDLWFEDSNAAAQAWKALAGKIAKARARRGSRIRSALLESDR
ncbi:hypothetical protein ACHAWX_007364 [Stephanocyclus meneghinianus]